MWCRARQVLRENPLLRRGVAWLQQKGSSSTVKTKLLMPASVDRPSWREIMNVIQSFQLMSSVRCIACLNELIGSASTDQQMDEMLEDSRFAALLENISDRAYGFSGTETYLMLVSLARLPEYTWRAAAHTAFPTEKAVSRLLDRCLEQLEEEADSLNASQICHFGLLLARFTSSFAHSAPSSTETSVSHRWNAYTTELAARTMGSSFRGKDLCLALKALSEAPGYCDKELLLSLEKLAIARLEYLSPQQLVSTLYFTTILGLRDEKGLQTAVAERLAPMASLLVPGQLSLFLLSLSLVKPLATSANLPQALLHRCEGVVHTFGVQDAISTLRSLCLLAVFPANLVRRLLQQAVKTPPTSLSDTENNQFHQVILSLLYEPCAQEALAVVRSMPDVWESAYRPDQVVGEIGKSHCQRTDDLAARTESKMNQWLSEVSDISQASIMRDSQVAGFYKLPVLLHLPGRCGAALDFDPDTPPWLPKEVLPTDSWRQLKQRHLQLWNISLIWERTRTWPAPTAGCTDAIADSCGKRVIEVVKDQLGQMHGDLCESTVQSPENYAATRHGSVDKAVKS